MLVNYSRSLHVNRKSLILKGVEWDSFVCLIYLCELPQSKWVGKIVYEHLEQAATRFNHDEDFRMKTKHAIESLNNYFLSLALLNGSENALKLFLNYRGAKTKTCLRLKSDLSEASISLFEKYELSKYFLFIVKV